MSKLLSPEEIATQAGGDATPNRLPSPRVFADRAVRLRQLAPGHAVVQVSGMIVVGQLLQLRWLSPVQFCQKAFLYLLAIPAFPLLVHLQGLVN